MPNSYRTLAASLAVGVACGSLGAVAASARPVTHSRIAAKPSHRRVPTPPDSYLQYKVYTVDQLIQQVTDNPSVRQRFARHFQMPEDRVVDYMRANLVESYIPKTGRYTVYCVHHSGKFYPVRQNFRRGTKVFALRNGEPVMKWVCGNPLTKFASSVTDIVSLPPKKPPMIAEFIPSDIENEIVPSEGPEVKLMPTVLVSPSLEALSPVSSAIYRGAGPSLAYGLLPVAGLVAVNQGGHHSNVVPPPADIPEAGSLLYLAAGVPVALFAIRRRKRAEASA